jgi:hypothetical protein
MNRLALQYIEAVLKPLKKEERERAHAALQEHFSQASGREEVEKLLLELGHPKEYRARFTKRERALISGVWADRYWWTLQIVAAPVLIIAILSAVIPPFFKPVRITTTLLITLAASALFSAVVQTFFWVTLTFFALSRSSITPPPWRWNERAIARLEEEDELVISKSSALSEAIFLSLVVVVLLVLSIKPEILTLRLGSAVRILLFEPTLIRPWLMGAIIVVLAQIALAISKYLAGLWSRPLVLLSAALTLVSTLYLIVFLTQWQLYHPSFLTFVGEGRLKVVVGGVSVLLGVLTLLDEVNRVWGVFRQTAHQQG